MAGADELKDELAVLIGEAIEPALPARRSAGRGLQLEAVRDMSVG